MEERIRQSAHASVMRGCGFGMLTIFTGMIGVASSLSLVLRTGGFGMLLMTFILILKAARAHRVPAHSTEIWVMLDEKDRPPKALAGRMIASARRETLLVFAYWSAIMAAVLLAAELVERIIG